MVSPIKTKSGQLSQIDLKQVNLINLTKHEIRFSLISIPPISKMVARISSTEDIIDLIKYKSQNIPIVETDFSKTVDLSPVKENTFYIVSLLVYLANPLRDDLLVPNTSNSIFGAKRDREGQIVYIKSLQRPNRANFNLYIPDLTE